MTLTRQDMRAAERTYWSQVHETKKHRPDTRKLLMALASRSQSEKEDLWPELEKIDPALWGKYITATHIKTAFRTYMDGLQGGRCCYCRVWLVANAHARPIDHILPRAEYPQYSLCFWNLVVACTDCNGTKTDNVWGGLPKTRRTYPKPGAFNEFFHARFHKYDDHIRYVIVETNSSLLTMYKGLTPQGRHLCTELLHKVAAKRTLFSSNPELRKSKAALDAHVSMANGIPMPALEAFQALLDQSVTRFIA